MNIPAYSSAAWGMADASRRFDGAAQNIAQGSTDLPSDLVEGTMLAPAAQDANATVVRIADDAYKSLIDIRA